MRAEKERSIQSCEYCV